MMHFYWLEPDLCALSIDADPMKPVGLMERIAVGDRSNFTTLKRLALCWNACAGLSEKSLEVLASGGGSSGTLAERALAWSLFVAASRPTARRFLERAQGIMEKQGGEA